MVRLALRLKPQKIRAAIKNNEAAFEIKEVKPQGILIDGSFEGFYLEYLFNKEGYGLKPEDDEVVAEHHIG